MSENKIQELPENGKIGQNWIWNHGLESIAFTGFNMKLSQDTSSVFLALSDTTDEQQFLTMKLGKISNSALNLTLGVNQNEIRSFQDQQINTWTAEYIGSSTNEMVFERLTPDKKPKKGSWPFDCQDVFPCRTLTHQTCGCKDKGVITRVTAYFLGTGSKLAIDLDFQSCEELKVHGVDITGYFMIKGVKTYCKSWSK